MTVVRNGVGTYQIGMTEKHRYQTTHYDTDHAIQLLLPPSPEVLPRGRESLWNLHTNLQTLVIVLVLLMK